MSEFTLAQRARARAESYDQRKMEELLDQIRDGISRLSDEGKFECILSVNGDSYSELIVAGVIRLLKADGFTVVQWWCNKDFVIKINW